MHGFPGALAAKSMHFRGMEISIGDIVFRGAVAGEVSVCASEGPRCFAIVQVWHEVSIAISYKGRVSAADGRGRLVGKLGPQRSWNSQSRGTPKVTTL